MSTDMVRLHLSAERRLEGGVRVDEPRAVDAVRHAGVVEHREGPAMEFIGNSCSLLRQRWRMRHRGQMPILRGRGFRPGGWRKFCWMVLKVCVCAACVESPQ